MLPPVGRNIKDTSSRRPAQSRRPIEPPKANHSANGQTGPPKANYSSQRLNRTAEGFTTDNRNKEKNNG